MFTSSIPYSVTGNPSRIYHIPNSQWKKEREGKGSKGRPINKGNIVAKLESCRPFELVILNPILSIIHCLIFVTDICIINSFKSPTLNVSLKRFHIVEWCFYLKAFPYFQVLAQEGSRFARFGSEREIERGREQPWPSFWNRNPARRWKTHWLEIQTEALLMISCLAIPLWIVYAQQTNIICQRLILTPFAL